MMKKMFFIYVCILLPTIINGMLKKDQLDKYVQPDSTTASKDDQVIINNYINFTANPHVQSAVSNAPTTNNRNNADNITATQAHLNNQSNAASFANAQAEADVDINIETNQLQQLQNTIGELVGQNKKKFILGILAAIYGTLYYYTEQGNLYLQDPLLWSVWHRELTLSAMRKIPHEQLMKDLLITIQQRYLFIEKPTDFTMPLSVFLKEIAQEEKKLRFYRKLYLTCSKLWIRRLLPFDVQAYRKIKARLLRINFLRASFVTWISHYNINQNTILN